VCHRCCRPALSRSRLLNISRGKQLPRPDELDEIAERNVDVEMCRPRVGSASSRAVDVDRAATRVAPWSHVAFPMTCSAPCIRQERHPWCRHLQRARAGEPQEQGWTYGSSCDCRQRSGRVTHAIAMFGETLCGASRLTPASEVVRRIGYSTAVSSRSSSRRRHSRSPW